MPSTTTAVSTRRPSGRSTKVASLVAIPAAITVSGLVVSQGSYSAYSATTENPTKNWATAASRSARTTVAPLPSPSRT